MAPTKPGSGPTWKSKMTPHRMAAFAIAAGFGIAACSPTGASTRYGSPAPSNPTTSSPAAAAAPTTPGTTAPIGAPAKVSIANFAFGPAVLTVKAGTAVTWTNNDVVAHTVAFTGAPVSRVLNRGDIFSRTFTAAGTFSYICSIHPFMHGTVVVTP